MLRLEDELRRVRARMEQLERELRNEIQLDPQAVPAGGRALRATAVACAENLKENRMDFNKLTIKCGEAVAARRSSRAARAIPS